MHLDSMSKRLSGIFIVANKKKSSTQKWLEDVTLGHSVSPLLLLYEAFILIVCSDCWVSFD